MYAILFAMYGTASKGLPGTVSCHDDFIPEDTHLPTSEASYNDLF